MSDRPDVAVRTGIEGDAEIEAKLIELEAKSTNTAKSMTNKVNDAALEAARKADESGQSIKDQLDADIDAALFDEGIDVAEFETKAKELMNRIDYQMYNEDIKINAEAQKLYAALKSVDLQAEITTMKASLTARQVKEIIERSYGMLTQVLNVFGVSLPPVLGAAISAVFTMATLLMQAGAGMLSNPYTAIIGAMSIASAVLSIAAAVEAQNKQAAMESKMRDVERTVASRSESVSMHAMVML